VLQPLILIKEKELNPQAEALVIQIRERARNLYETRQLLCAEAVVTALNHGLDGGLSDAQVVAITATLCIGLGESGCLCGALSGAAMACGLFLGNDSAYNHRGEIRNSAREIHDAFKTANGATCCRVLSKKIKDDKKAHFRQCAELTAQATELATRLILQKKPELMNGVQKGFLAKRQSKLMGAVARLFHYFSHTGTSSC